jgi:hypothetical protein
MQQRLRDVGAVFRVPGDYAFPADDDPLQH